MAHLEFGKEERLKSKKTIASLFKEGKSFGQYPLRILWTTLPMVEGMASFQFTASVPKRKFKLAVNRNRIRRQVKEAYRLHKHLLFEASIKEDTSYAIMVLYTGKESLPYEDIDKAMQNMIARFLEKI